MPVTIDKPQRSFKSELNLVMLSGLMNLKIDCVPQKVPGTDKATSFNQLCPDCDEPRRLSQRMVCETHGAIDPDRDDSEKKRGREVDGVLTEFSEEEIAAITGVDIADDELRILVCHASQLESETRPDGTAYRLRPAKKGTSMEAYGLLRDLAKDRDLAFYGEIVLRGHQKLARIETWNDQLMLQVLIRPDDLVVADQVEAEGNEKMVAMAKDLLPIEDFDPALHTNRRKERMVEIEAAKAANPGQPAVITPMAPKSDGGGGSLMALLEASIAAKASAAA